MLDNPKTTPILLLIVSVLLVGQLAVGILSLRQSQVQAAFRAEQAQLIEDQLDLQTLLTSTIFDDYQDDAYGPSVDRIAEQQLIATEYQLLALQSLNLQNRHLADLLLLSYLDVPDAVEEEDVGGVD